MAGKQFFSTSEVQKGKIFSLEVFIFLQSDNFPLECFFSPLLPSLYIFSRFAFCSKWTLSHARRYLTWICSAFGRNQWGLQVSLKCCCSFSSPSLLVHRFAPTYTRKIACPRQKRRSWKKFYKKSFFFRMFFEKLEIV